MVEAIAGPGAQMTVFGAMRKPGIARVGGSDC